FPVDIEGVVGMLDRGYAIAPRRQLGDEALGHGGLAGILPPGNAENPVAAHDASARYCRASSRSSAVLMLKNGSSVPPRQGTGEKSTSQCCRPSMKPATLPCPARSQASSAPARLTGHSPITGWRR